MFKNRVLILSIFLFSFAFLETSYAQTAGDYKIPLPPGAEELQSQDFILAGTDRNINTYRIKLSSEEVMAFYNQQMPKQGWSREISDADPTGNAVNFNNPQLKSLSNTVVNYAKGDYRARILVMPASVNLRDKSTVFAVSSGKKIDINSKNAEKPAEKVGFMPVYPEAKLLFQAGSAYTYSTPDDITKVALFFKNNLPFYGWQLSQETPIHAKDISAVTGNIDDILTNTKSGCIDCEKDKAGADEMKKQIKEFMGEMRILSARLVYAKPNGESLKIEFENVDLGSKKELLKGNAVPGTSIRVSYYAQQ